MNDLPRLGPAATVDDVLACLREAGCCVVERLADQGSVDAINAELAPAIAATPCSPFAGPGQRTRRTGALAAHSRAAHALIAHPLVTGAATAFLRPRSGNIQLAVTQHICVEPGEEAGALHRDDCAWDLPRFAEATEVEVSTLWALDPFRAENGATLIAPGSHDGEGDPADFAGCTVAAEMPAGSVAIYTGRLVHGSGANRTQGARRAAHITYCTDWLRPKENQFLSVPLDMVRQFDPRMHALLGYEMGGFMLGYTRNFEHPQVAIHPERQMPLGG